MKDSQNTVAEPTNVVRDAIREEPPYLTTEDVTRLLHISKTTLWQLRRDGAIKGHHVRRRVLFKRKDVDDLVDRGASV